MTDFIVPNALPIEIGFPWPGVQVEVNTTDVIFDAAGSYLADVRAAPLQGPPLFALTTESGELSRVNDQTVNITMLASHTALISPDVTAVVFDIIRTDVTPQQYLYIRLFVSVNVPITPPYVAPTGSTGP